MSDGASASQTGQRHNLKVWTRNPLRIIERMPYHLAEIGNPGANDVVVDLACGKGTCALEFAPKVKKVTAFDWNREQVDACKGAANKKGLTNLEAILRDVQKPLPLPDKSIDIVTASGALSNIDNPQRTLKEVRRILKPGGRLLVADVCIPEAVQEVWAVVSSMHYGSRRPYLDYGQFMDLLYSNGFEPLVYRPIRWRYSMSRVLSDMSPELRSASLLALRQMDDESKRRLRLQSVGDDVVVEPDCFALSASVFCKQPRWFIDDTTV